MKVTGHRTRSMFARYNIASPEDKREALKKARLRGESLGRGLKRHSDRKPNSHTNEHT